MRSELIVLSCALLTFTACGRGEGRKAARDHATPPVEATSAAVVHPVDPTDPKPPPAAAPSTEPADKDEGSAAEQAGDRGAGRSTPEASGANSDVNEAGQTVAEPTPAMHRTPTPVALSFERRDHVEFAFQVPESPRGVVYYFHGSGTSARAYADRAVAKGLVKEGLDRGFAAVVLDSDDRSRKQWSFSPTGPDMRRLRQIIDTLRSRGVLDPSLPQYAAGVSNGGGFAAVAAVTLDLNAVAILAAGASNSFGSMWKSTPVLFAIGENDPIINPTEVAENVEICQQRGIVHRHIVKREGALTVDILRGVPGVNRSTAQQILDGYTSAGLVDQNGTLKAKPDDKRFISALPKSLRGSGVKLDDLKDALDIANAGHTMFPDHYSKVFDFFERFAE